MGASIDNLFTAILNDDRLRVKELLKADLALATSRIEKAKLYQAKIFHWIYVGDTPLHLAAAGYRLRSRDCCWRRVPIRWRPPIIVAAARCITQPMVTLPDALGIRTGK